MTKFETNLEARKQARALLAYRSNLYKTSPNATLFAILFCYVAVLLMAVVGPIKYEALEIKTWVYYLGVTALITIGFLFGTRQSRNATSPNKGRLVFSTLGVFRVLAAVATIGGLVVCVGFLSAGQSFSTAIQNTSESRDLLQYNTGMMVTFAAPFYYITAPVFSLGCYLMICLPKKDFRFQDYFALFALFAVQFAAALLNASRLSIMIMILCFASTVVIFRQQAWQYLRTNRFGVLAGGALLCLVLLYFQFISENRVTRSYSEYVLQSTEMRYGALPEALGVKTASGLVLLCSYLGQAPHNIQDILNSDIPMGSLNTYVFAWPIGQFMRLFNDFGFVNISHKQYMERFGLTPYVWYGAPFILILTFGKIGGVLMIFIPAYILGSFVRRCVLQATVGDVMGGIWMVAIAFVSPLTPIVYGEFWCPLALIILLRLFRIEAAKL